jgi:hypothetical protein
MIGRYYPRFNFAFCAAACLFMHFPLSAQESASTNSRAAAVLDSMPTAKKISEVALSADGAKLPTLSTDSYR